MPAKSIQLKIWFFVAHGAYLKNGHRTLQIKEQTTIAMHGVLLSLLVAFTSIPHIA